MRRLFPLFFALCFSALFVYYNMFDWDMFLTQIEVDTRSWIYEGKPPGWTYQYCGGTDRSGDPQSYGFSPLILWSVLIGSFWGSKLIFFTGVLVGALYFRKILTLLAPTVSFLEEGLLTLGFFGMNFFLGHFGHGHLSFTSLFYGLPLLYLILKFVLSKEIRFSEHLHNLGFLILAFSGPFYQVSIYFFLPFLVAFLLYLVADFRSGSKNYRDLGRIVLVSILSILFCSFRFFFVLKHMERMSIKSNFHGAFSPEWHNPLAQIFYFFNPVWLENFVLPFPAGTLGWGTAEYSFFGAYSFLLPILLWSGRKNLRPWAVANRSLLILVASFVITGMLFSMGGTSPYLPFGFLNHLSKNALRISGRFNFITYLGVMLLVLRLFPKTWNRKWTKYGVFGILLIAPITSLLQQTFLYMNDNAVTTAKYLSLKRTGDGRMKAMDLVKPFNYISSYMYESVMNNHGVINCYLSLPIQKIVPEHQVPIKDLFFIEGPQTEECRKKSYFTQQHISIDPTCRRGSPLIFNHLAPGDAQKYGIQFNGKYYEVR